MLLRRGGRCLAQRPLGRVRAAAEFHGVVDAHRDAVEDHAVGELFAQRRNGVPAVRRWRRAVLCEMEKAIDEGDGLGLGRVWRRAGMEGRVWGGEPPFFRRVGHFGEVQRSTGSDRMRRQGLCEGNVRMSSERESYRVGRPRKQASRKGQRR